MKLLLGFLFVVVAGAMWEARRERSTHWLPMLGLSTFVAVTFYSVYRLI